MSAPYPHAGPARDRWILARRPPRLPLDPLRAAAAFVEEETAESGAAVSVATIFLTNRECPWRCLMCDLWRQTLTETVPDGAIPAQIEEALARLPRAARIKLYNAGSFFDPKAIPPHDLESVAQLTAGFERVIVECHPALVGAPAARFRDLLAGGLEVAMGLETVHPEILPRLNKRTSIGGFRRAAEFLRAEAIGIRVFVLAGLPFCSEEEGLLWAERSIEAAFDLGAGTVSVIPTRMGNGALEALARRGEFREPSLATLEAALEFGLELGGGRVFADLWDLGRFRRCAACFEARSARLAEMNRRQAVVARVSCSVCAGGS